MTNPIPACGHDGLQPGRLWSPLEMLKVTAQEYINLGRQIHDAETSFIFRDVPEDDLGVQKRFEGEHDTRLKFHMKSLQEACKKIGLTTSLKLIARRTEDVPRTIREFNVIVDAIWAELDGKLFLFVPPERAKYYEVAQPSIFLTRFYGATVEIHAAGNCIATGNSTAAVFHCMRAVEIGVRAMARRLKVKFTYPLELAEWGKIIEQIESRINALKAGPRSSKKDENLRFYSEAAAQFRHFNNAWRVRTAHARASYNEQQAMKVYDHTVSFLMTLASRLKEKS